MKRNSIFYLFALLAMALVGATAFVQGGQDVKTINLTILVRPPLIDEGGVVFVIPNRMSRYAFNDRYSSKIESARAAPGSRTGGEAGLIALEARIADQVTFIHFDVPEGDYSYRFLPDVTTSRRDGVVREKQVSIGSGSAYRAASTGATIDAPLVLAHYIEGSKISEADGVGIASSASHFTVNDNDCTSADGVRICSGSAADLENLMRYFAKGEAESRQ